MGNGYRSDWLQWIKESAAKYGVDPRAAIAIARHEGLSGGVGDGGHAFGPFQLNDAGGVITNRPGNHRAFAESRAGIDWAIQKMANSGARGLHGRAAITAIATNFERPANVAGEIADASRMYGAGLGSGGHVGSPQGASGGFTGASGAIPPVPSAPTGGVDPKIYLNAMAQQLLQNSSQTVNTGSPMMGSSGLAQMAQMRQMYDSAQSTFGSGGIPQGAPVGGNTGSHYAPPMPNGHGYVHPLVGARFGRLDQGIDYQGRVGQRVAAIGKARVDAVKSDPNGFGQVVYYTLLEGPRAGQQVYVGHAQPNVRAGMVIGPGHPVATLLSKPLGNATQPGWTEIGWAHNGMPTSPGEANKASAQDFQSFLGTIK